MESFDAWPEKQHKGPPPPFLPLSGEATDWLASLEILCQFCQDFIDKRLKRAWIGAAVEQPVLSGDVACMGTA